MDVRRLDLRKDKRGDLESIFVITTIIFGFAIFLVVLGYIVNQVGPKIGDAIDSTTDTTNPVNATQTMDEAYGSTRTISNLFPLFLLGLFGYVFISAFFIKSSPIFFFVGIVILGIVLLLSAIFSNVYHQIGDHETFASTTDDMGVSDKIMEYLPIVMLIGFVIVGFLLWGKVGGSQGGY